MLHEKRGRREEHCDHRKGENNDAERQIANEAQKHREHQRVAAADQKELACFYIIKNYFWLGVSNVSNSLLISVSVFLTSISPPTWPAVPLPTNAE